MTNHKPYIERLVAINSKRRPQRGKTRPSVVGASTILLHRDIVNTANYVFHHLCPYRKLARGLRAGGGAWRGVGT